MDQHWPTLRLFHALLFCRDLATKLPLLADDDLEEMVEASLMLEDPRFFLDNWEQGETVRAVSQWEDVSYQVFSDVLF